MVKFYYSKRSGVKDASYFVEKPTRTRKNDFFSWSLMAMFFFTMLCSLQSNAQTTYYSKAAATDFNDVNSWGTATDGTGAAPGSISNADNFIVANNATLNLNGNASVRQLSINAGTLNVAANTLTVSKVGAFDTTLSIASGATLNVTGGAINLNGQFAMVAGAIFKQSSGVITVDGNNGGVAAGSIAGNIVVLYGTPTTLQLTGGTLVITDPSYTTSYALYGNCSTATNIGTGHTIQFGDGVSSDAGGTNGFYTYLFPGSSYLVLGKVVANGGAGTNRFVSTTSTVGILGDLTINANSEYRVTSTNYLTGNLINNGTLTTTSVLGFASYANATLAAATNSQTVSGSGIFRNLTAAPTASFNSITINNTSVGGVTFAGTTNIASQPTNSVSVSGTLTFTAGRVFTSGGASFILGVSTPAAGTLSYTSGGFASGVTFGRWFTAAGTGSAFIAGTDVSSATSRYPFVDANGQGRSAWIERTTPAGAGGILGIVYTNVAGTTSGTYTDGATNLDTKANDYWTVSSLSGTPTAAASLKIQMVAPGIFGGTLATASTRVIKTDNTFTGTHEAGTTTPGGHRIGITPANFIGSFTLVANNADIPFASVTNGDWNVTSTWNKGTIPTCTDPVTIAAGTTVTSNSSGNVAKNIIVNLGGTLVNASGDLTVGCTLNNNFLTNNGTLTVSGGTLNINGNLLNNANSTFNQSGGNITIDGNAAGVAANSVATGTTIARFNSNLVNLTGGTLTVVDPHVGTATSDYALGYSQSANANATTAHTTVFGNGASTDTTTNTGGFIVDPYLSTARLNFGNVIVNGASASGNRFVTLPEGIGIAGDLTVNALSEIRFTGLYLNVIGGNILNNGTLVSNVANFALGKPNTTAVALDVNPNAQNVSGSGVFNNALASPTANTANLIVNNSNAVGVTLNVPLSISGTLTLTQGFVNTTNANLLTLGTAAAAGTLVGGSTTAYVKGPFSRTIASGNANSNYILYPVGKTAYNPVSLAPTTTAVTVMKAEAFDANAGTTDASILSLSSKRWEAPIISGTVTNVNVRIGDAGIGATNIPVQAPSAAGVYTSSAFGSTATYAAGTPNTVTSNTAASSAGYTGFLSYAVSNACSGTPTPGATTTTASTICLGGSVTLGITTIPTGSGVTYQWQSSPDGVSYADIPTATNSTYVATPTAATYYQCLVTCTTGPASATSSPIQITFTNNITGTTPGTRCGTGTVNLAANASSGTINWYAAASGGASLGSGSPFTTPSISGNTTYYAAAEGTSSGVVQFGAGTTTTGTTNLSAFNNYRSSAKVQLIYTASELQSFGLRAGNINSIALNVNSLGSAATNANYIVNIGTTALSTFPNTTFLTPTFTTCYGPSTYTHTASGWQTINFTTPYNWDGVSNLVLEISHDGINSSASADTYTTATTGNTVLYSYNNLTANNTLSTNRFNVLFSGQVVCSSPRVAVAATVTTPPAFTLSSNTATICNGSSSSAITVSTGGADYDTYLWSPATGVTGNAGSGWIFNPNTTTTYTLTASQSSGSLCTTTATVTVTVNPQPSVVTISPVSATVCEGTVQALIASGGTLPGSASATIGSATTLTSATAQPTAFCNRFKHYWSQMVFTAAELTAAGVQAGNINSIKFNITTLGDGANVSSFKVYMAHTASTTLTGFTTTGLVQVFSAATYNHAVGVNTITFNTPFTWDGTSNVIVDIRQTGADALNNAQTYYTATPDNKTVYATTSTTYASSDAYAATNPAATTSLNRLNTTFDYTANTPNPITWSPITDLYTDAAATIPYTGTNATTVYFKSSTIGATSYTATATTAATCTRSASVGITVTPNRTISLSSAVGTDAQTVCINSPITNITYALGNETNANVLGLPAGVTGVYSSGLFTISGTPTAAGTFNYTVTPVGCGTAIATGSIVVNQTAMPTAPDQTFCNAATVADLVATGTAIQWYAGLSGGSALASTDALTTGTYYVTQTLNSCESPRNAISITVNVTAQPTASSQTFCNAATVADLVATGTAIQWYSGPSGGSALASTDALATGTYYVTQTISGCESPRLAVSVTVNVTAQPTASSQTFCNAATVADLVATGTAIQWYSGPSGGSALASTDALATGTYYVTQTISGCESPRNAISITVNVTAQPTASSQTFCNAATVADLVATGTAIQWYAGPSGGSALASTDALATGTYYVTQTISGCESPRLAVSVTVNVTAAPTGATTQAFVQGQTIADIVVTGSNVVWYPSALDAMNGTNALASSDLLVNNTTYYATQTIGGCESDASLAVTVTVTLGVSDFDTTSFKVYPNPVIDILNVTHASKISTIEVYNAIGQQVIVKSINQSTGTIDMSRLAGGTYFVKVTMDNAVKTVKVIKK